MKTRVLVVDDSAFMRKFVTRIIEEEPTLEVVAVAKNGMEAVQLAHEHKPDVITMDIEMPIMNGLEALKRIMQECPTPVVMLSTHAHQDANETVIALQYGAIDFIQKPSGSISIDLYVKRDEIISKIKMAARTPAGALSLRSANQEKKPRPASTLARRARPMPKAALLEQIVAIGTSTGGPKALEIVLSELPVNFPYPVVVVQHMPPKFTQSLAQRLDRVCDVRVVEATDKEKVVGGTVYIAPGDFHMTVFQRHDELYIQLNRDNPRNGHRPSVDVLFESVAQLKGLVQHYVLMTGMGNDGAEGMALAKQAGARTTIAESEETCVVFGMPKAAIDKNCVDWVLPVNKIGAKILEVTGL